jgi:hypothetical protein
MTAANIGHFSVLLPIWSPRFERKQPLSNQIVAVASDDSVVGLQLLKIVGVEGFFENLMPHRFGVR